MDSIRDVDDLLNELRFLGAKAAEVCSWVGRHYDTGSMEVARCHEFAAALKRFQLALTGFKDADGSS
jgi:hypothetical protein